jgi:FAD/FMN-containing dehydrogenase
LANAVMEIELLQANMDGLVIGKNHSDYDKYRKLWNGISDRQPAAIVRARSVSDVRKTIEIAGKSGALIAVRCGGHSLPGHSSCDAGIVLDMSLINDVVVDSIKGTADVGGGAHLADLDEAGARVGLVTPAGVVSHTGVAGLTLGGGMGWLSRRFGMTVDNLLGAEVVTADGSVVWASDDSEPELFWGLRGGGGNFGVVTKFRFRMHKLGPIVVGCWTYLTADCEKILRGFQDLSESAPRELTASFAMMSNELVVTACWSGAAEDAAKMVSPFGSLASEVSGSFVDMDYTALQKRSDETDAWGQRHYSKGGFLEKLDDTAIKCMKDAVAQAPNDRSDIYLLQLGGAISDVDENATPYSGRTASYYWIANAIWDDPVDDARCMEWGRNWAKKLSAISMQGNYVNEQSDIGKDVARSAYGPEKYSRLAKIKYRYDPANLFRLNQNIEPKA